MAVLSFELLPSIILTVHRASTSKRCKLSRTKRVLLPSGLWSCRSLTPYSQPTSHTLRVVRSILFHTGLLNAIAKVRRIPDSCTVCLLPVCFCDHLTTCSRHEPRKRLNRTCTWGCGIVASCRCALGIAYLQRCACRKRLTCSQYRTT